LLPVRSSLYACFPSVGASLIAAEICSALWRASPSTRQRRAMVAAIVLVIAAAPIYRARSRRWVDPAEFSASILRQLERLTAPLPDESSVVLIDERDTRVNLASAFGTLVSDACLLQTGRRHASLTSVPNA